MFLRSESQHTVKIKNQFFSRQTFTENQRSEAIKLLRQREAENHLLSCEYDLLTRQLDYLANTKTEPVLFVEALLEMLEQWQSAHLKEYARTLQYWETDGENDLTEERRNELWLVFSKQLSLLAENALQSAKSCVVKQSMEEYIQTLKQEKLLKKQQFEFIYDEKVKINQLIEEERIKIENEGQKLQTEISQLQQSEIKTYPLHHACQNKNLDEIKNYIEKTPFLTTKKVWLNPVRTEDGNTPLHIACVLQWPDGIQLLLANGADATLPNKQGYTPFHLLCKYTAQFYSVREGNTTKKQLLNIIDSLCQKYKQTLFLGAEYGRTPLHLATWDGCVSTCAVLLKYDHPTECITNNGDEGQTPLFNAIRNGLYHCVDLLLQNKANVKALNRFGAGVLEYAVTHSDANMVKLLIKYGARPLSEDHQFGSLTALVNTATRFQKMTCVPLLIKAVPRKDLPSRFLQAAVELLSSEETQKHLQKQLENQATLVIYFQQAVLLKVTGNPLTAIQKMASVCPFKIVLNGNTVKLSVINPLAKKDHYRLLQSFANYLELVLPGLNEVEEKNLWKKSVWGMSDRLEKKLSKKMISLTNKEIISNNDKDDIIENNVNILHNKQHIFTDKDNNNLFEINSNRPEPQNEIMLEWNNKPFIFENTHDIKIDLNQPIIENNKSDKLQAIKPKEFNKKPLPRIISHNLERPPEGIVTSVTLTCSDHQSTLLLCSVLSHCSGKRPVLPHVTLFKTTGQRSKQETEDNVVTTKHQRGNSF